MTKNTNTNTLEQQAPVEQLLLSTPVSRDLMTAVLIVSVVVNLIVLTTWIAIQVTSQYDTQLAALLFNN
jgi:hypothetical protein